MPQNKTKTFRSFSSQTTKAFAKEVAQKVKLKKPGKKAVVVALFGDLGSGKTTFTQGFLRALGVRKKITSPTFLIMRKFEIRNSKFEKAYHLDAYRLRGAKDLRALGLKKVLEDPKNIVLIEWADRVKSLLPKGTIRLKFSYGKKENERGISAH